MTDLPTQEYFNISEVSRITKKAINTVKKALDHEETKDAQKQLRYEVINENKMMKHIDIMTWAKSNGHVCDFTLADKKGKKVHQDTNSQPINAAASSPSFMGEDAASSVSLLKQLLDEERTARKEDNQAAKDREEFAQKQLEEANERLKQAQAIKLLEDGRETHIKEREDQLISSLSDQTDELKIALKTERKNRDRFKKIAHAQRDELKKLKPELARAKAEIQALSKKKFAFWSRGPSQEQNTSTVKAIKSA